MSRGIVSETPAQRASRKIAENLDKVNELLTEAKDLANEQDIELDLTQVTDHIDELENDDNWDSSGCSEDGEWDSSNC